MQAYVTSSFCISVCVYLEVKVPRTHQFSFTSIQHFILCTEKRKTMAFDKCPKNKRKINQECMCVAAVYQLDRDQDRKIRQKISIRAAIMYIIAINSLEN